jgi:hypothetical protein
MMSHQHKDIATIISENKEKTVLSKKESAQILARLTITSGCRFSTEEVECLLELGSLPGPTRKWKKPDTKAKSGKRQLKTHLKQWAKNVLNFQLLLNIDRESFYPNMNQILILVVIMLP